jgi:hypothetical protein
MVEQRQATATAYVTFGGTVDERADLSIGFQGGGSLAHKIGQRSPGSDPILRRGKDGGRV